MNPMAQSQASDNHLTLSEIAFLAYIPDNVEIVPASIASVNNRYERD